MIDDLVGLTAAAATDIAIDQAAKRHRWARILKMFNGLLVLAFVILLVYVTVKYS
ncbi:MAG: hypothetical protein HZA59_06085 [Hydrogenophilales bacterium]|nr:hypothetical protein [Hydrogenophilales bacterium]